MTAPRFMPAQKPGKSVQEVGTPREFLGAVERRFGKITWDLAANEKNKVAFMHLGPGSAYPDALAEDWSDGFNGLLWLNPPYSKIGPWAQKCHENRGDRSRIAFLVPAGVSTKWFRNYVHEKALVLFISPKLTFVGHEQQYPKDLILAMYGEKPGYECWRWKP